MDLNQNRFQVQVRWSYTLEGRSAVVVGEATHGSLLTGQHVCPTETRGFNTVKGFNPFVFINHVTCTSATKTHHFKSLLLQRCDVTLKMKLWPRPTSGLQTSACPPSALNLSRIKHSQTLHLFHFEPSRTQIK